MKTQTALIAALAVLTMPVMASARTADQARATVRLDDLNLGSSAGQKLVKARIKSAIRAVCGESTVRDLAANAAVHKCASQAQVSATQALESRATAVVVATR